MTQPNLRSTSEASRRQVLAGIGGLAGLAALPAVARAPGEPIKIGVIAEASTLPGAAIPRAAEMAVDEINAMGGVLGRPLQLVVYDDHVHTVDAVRAFQRLVSQDKVVAVIASWISEVALALEPWSARLKMPFITPGASSNNISEQVHNDYDRFKYTFHGWQASDFVARTVSDSAHDLLVDQLHMKECVVMSEDAAWTTPLDAAYLEFLPKAGLEVLDHIRFSPDTTDFTPIFNKIEASHPEVIITGIAHVGVVPTVQWAQQRVPIPMYGANAQATVSTFWKETHGAAEGAVGHDSAGPDAAITPRTLPFTNGYLKRYGTLPAYCGYTSYDMVYVIAEAIARENSTDPDKMVAGLEATDHIGTVGRIQFYGRNDRFTHSVRYGAGFFSSVMIQWQQAKMKTIWPLKYATAKISFPSFVKLPA